MKFYYSLGRNNSFGAKSYRQKNKQNRPKKKKKLGGGTLFILIQLTRTPLVYRTTTSLALHIGQGWRQKKKKPSKNRQKPSECKT